MKMPTAMERIRQLFAAVRALPPAGQQPPEQPTWAPVRSGDSYRHKRTLDVYVIRHVGLMKQHPLTEWTPSVTYAKQATGEVFTRDYAHFTLNFTKE